MLKIGDIIKKKLNQQITFTITGYWIHPHTKEIWYEMKDKHGGIFSLYENDIIYYDVIEVEDNSELLPPFKEKLYTWYSITDEGEYWLDSDLNEFNGTNSNYRTIVSDGKHIYTYDKCYMAWGNMAKNEWKYMRIEL